VKKLITFVPVLARACWLDCWLASLVTLGCSLWRHIAQYDVTIIDAGSAFSFLSSKTSRLPLRNKKLNKYPVNCAT